MVGKGCCREVVRALTVDRRFFWIRLLLGKALVHLGKCLAREMIVGSNANPARSIPSVADGWIHHNVVSWFALGGARVV